MNLGMSILQFPFSASSSFAGRYGFIFKIFDFKLLLSFIPFSWLYGDYGCQLYGAAGFFFGIGVVISMGLIILEGFLIISGKRIIRCNLNTMVSGLHVIKFHQIIM